MLSHTVLLQSLCDKNQFEKADELFVKALELEPDNANTIVHRGWDFVTEFTDAQCWAGIDVFVILSVWVTHDTLIMPGSFLWTVRWE